MINTLVYYGLSMSAGSIVGNRYGNFILCSLIEIPALFLVIKILNNYGRRESQCVTLLLCSSLCFSIAFIPKRKYIFSETLNLTVFKTYGIMNFIFYPLRGYTSDF